jgi:DNA-binding transcriptional LysR family regulator
MIQLHQLEGFYRVATAGNYARAAREFPYPITQPGVHAQVRKLEQELEVRLLERIAKDRMAPTRAGRSLLEFCAPFFERLPGVVDAVRRGGATGRLRIEAGPLEIQELLPAWVRRIRARHPDIEVELREIGEPNPVRLLQDDVDLIVEHQTEPPPGIASRIVGMHHSFLALPRSHPLAARKRLDVRGLSQDPFVAFHAGLSQRGLQLGALRALGAEPRQWTSAPSVASILCFVAAGLGYSLIPWPHPRGPRVRGVVAIPLHGPGAKFPIAASFRIRRDRDPVIDAALDLAPSP